MQNSTSSHMQLLPQNKSKETDVEMLTFDKTVSQDLLHPGDLNNVTHGISPYNSPLPGERNIYKHAPPTSVADSQSTDHSQHNSTMENEISCQHINTAPVSETLPRINQPNEAFNNENQLSTASQPNSSVDVGVERSSIHSSLQHVASSNDFEAQQVLAEDAWSSMFIDGVDRMMDATLSSSANLISEESDETFSNGTQERLQQFASGRLNGWTYSTPFDPVHIDIDVTDKELSKWFIIEGNAMLEAVAKEVQTSIGNNHVVTQSNLTRLQVLNVFLPEYLLAKIVANVNRVLVSRSQPPTTIVELRGIIVLHVLAASYHSSVSVIASPDNSDFFYSLNISARRYSDVWSSLCCTEERRQHVESFGTGWTNVPQRANALITELEQELDAVNRIFLYVPGATVFSLDDDHQRLRSRSVTQLTTLSQINNPKKALGPVNNAVCSALHTLFFSLVTTLDLRRSFYTFGIDRGYNDRSVVDFVNDDLGATSIGTHKRSLDFPFVWGNGPIRKRHKGMEVSEKGCRAVYSATRKASTSAGRRIESVVYRESYSGRIAAAYHNNENLFHSSRYTMIPKLGFPCFISAQFVAEYHTVFNTGISLAASPSATNALSTVCRLKLNQVLMNVKQVTLLQSEDSGWFLARAFHFTSRPTQCFFRALTIDFDLSLEACASLISGQSDESCSVHFSSDQKVLRSDLADRLEHFCMVTGMKKGSLPSCEDGQDASRQVMEATSESLGSRTKEQIIAFMAAVGHRVSRSLNKSAIIDRVLKLRDDVEKGRASLNMANMAQTSEQRLKGLQDRLVSRLYKNSLDSWAMKPLVATSGMKEGSRNESQVLKALPQFFDKHKMRIVDSHSEMCSWNQSNFEVRYVRTIGLVSSKSVCRMSDSPDGLIVLVDDEEAVHVAAVEIKTMSSLGNIEEARCVSRKYSNLVLVNVIGSIPSSTSVFNDVVPTTEYRMQCIHHAVCFDCKHVLFVVAKGRNTGVGEILFSALLGFGDELKTNYKVLLTGIRLCTFRWVGQRADKIPKEYDDLLKGSYASDLFSFASFYGISKAYCELVDRKGALPPARMIRPSLFVYWNSLKGGVDEFSRAMKSLCYTNSSENPVVSVLGRLISAQVNNAAIIYRLSLAKRGNSFPDAPSSETFERGYKGLCHSVSRQCTFGDFARNLAKEYKLYYKDKRLMNRSESIFQSQNEINVHLKDITPCFKRNAAERYNRPNDRMRRLSNPTSHVKVKSKQSYCSLCSYSVVIRKNGKTARNKGGARQNMWCEVCRQPICSGIWEKWHTVHQLERATISEEDLEVLRQKVDEYR